MIHKSIVLLLITVFLLPMPGLAGMVSVADFEVNTTRDLIDLCAATPDDPLYQQAINFCHGYMIGAYHYHQAMMAGPDGVKLVCMPNPEPSRNEEIARFTKWAEAHPEYFDESAVDTEFRYLMQRFPCE